MKIEIDVKDFIAIDAVSVADAFIKNHSIDDFDEYMTALQRLMSDLYHRIDVIENAISVMNDNKIDYNREQLKEKMDYLNNPLKNIEVIYQRLEEFKSEFLLKKCCGKESYEDLGDEEWDIYNDKDTDENFADWLVNEKGYSREVAEATTVYNECGEWGEYHAYYYIDEVEFIKSDNKGNGN